MKETITLLALLTIATLFVEKAVYAQNVQHASVPRSMIQTAQRGLPSAVFEWEADAIAPASNGKYVFTARSPIPFTGLAVGWRALDSSANPKDFQLEIRTRETTKTWNLLQTHGETTPNETPSGLFWSHLYITPDGGVHTDYEVQIQAPRNTSLRYMIISVADASAGLKVSGTVAAQPPTKSGDVIASFAQPTIIPRSDWWGNLPAGEINAPRWAPVAITISHAVLHHTVDYNNPANPAQIVRQIWDYHANSQGWGDIGYNFLVDHFGNIYQGRYNPWLSTTDTRAAHAGGGGGGANAVSVGVALIGQFHPPLSNPPAAMPDSRAMRSTENLIAWRFEQRSLDPLGTANIITYWGNQNLDRITGHRKIGTSGGATDCPGDNLYNQLPEIRANVKNLLIPTVTVTFQTSPPGLQILVDGVTYLTPVTFNWQAGSIHVVTAPSPQDGQPGVRYVFESWSNGQSQTFTITVPSINTLYTAFYSTEYFLTMNAGSGGTVTPVSGWRKQGAGVSISATPNSGFVFNGWTGSGANSYTGSNNLASITMNGPITQTASFAQNPQSIQVKVETKPFGRSFSVDGVTYSTPQSFTWVSGSTHTIATTSPQDGGTKTRYVWSSWSDDGAISHTIAPTSDMAYTANFTTQYLLTTTIQTNPSGAVGGAVNFNPTGVSGGCVGTPESPVSCFWYNSGQNVQLTAITNNGYAFTDWIGIGTTSYTGTSNPAFVTMTEPADETANFIQASEKFTDVSAPLIAVSSSAFAWGDYDNDGDLDLLLAGQDESWNAVTKIYRNDGNSFYDIQAALPGVYNGAAVWGDFDNDGDLDILLTGYTGSIRIAKIFKNNAGSFAEHPALLVGVTSRAADWGDYDNDGDLDILLAGSNGSKAVSKVYRNDGGTFTDIAAALPQVQNGAALWGDYDVDGDLDILLTGAPDAGSPISKIYRNDEGNFVGLQASLVGVSNSSAAWGDYDHDGRLDVLLAGDTGAGRAAKIYRNAGGSFEEAPTLLPGVQGSSVAWGDCDNDGDFDILMTGLTSAPSRISKIYRNDGGNFVEVATPLIGVNWGSAVWGDYDNDGDLDIALAGANSDNSAVAKIYRNNSPNQNTVPSTPTNLSSLVTGGTAALSWSKATDAQTEQNALTYNLRLGTTSGGIEKMSPMANLVNGYRKTPKLGNTNHRSSWTIKNLPPGTYYWSVQTIDNMFAGSAFTAVQQFTIAPKEAWPARYNGSSDDQAKAVAVDAAGNVYVTGFSVGSDGYQDYLTIKYNSSGKRQWLARYNGPGKHNDAAQALAVDVAGNVYVTGYCYNKSGTSTFYATLKYNSTGVLQWARTYNDSLGNGDDKAVAIAVDGAGNVFVTGVGADFDGRSDFVTIKYDNLGAQQWRRRFEGPKDNGAVATALALDNSGNVYVTGCVFNLNGVADIATVKYANNGIERWFRTYNGLGNAGDEATALAICPAGNVYVAGVSTGANGHRGYVTIKYNGGGTRLWDMRYDGPSSLADALRAITVDNGSNVYVTGSSPAQNGFADYATLKYDSNGIQQWLARYNGPANQEDVATSLAVDANGNVFVTGYSARQNGGVQHDYATIKYNSGGIKQWLSRYNGPGGANDLASALKLDAHGNVFVTGYSFGAGGSNDYATVKYTTSGGSVASEELEDFESIELEEVAEENLAKTEQKNSSPSSYRLQQNFPNPFNPSTKISFVLPHAGEVSLRIYNETGQLVRTLAKRSMSAGVHELDWNGRNQAGEQVVAGVYLYQILVTNDHGEVVFNETKRMTLLK